MSRALPSVPRVVNAAIVAANIGPEVLGIDELSGGCIHRVIRLRMQDGAILVVKVNRGIGVKRMFDAEAEGLRAIGRSQTLPVPSVLAVAEAADEAALLMTHLCSPVRSPDAQIWAQFGRQLAALHEVNVGDRYGFEMDNFIGSTPQINTWCDDWVEFNARYRLGYQFERAVEHGQLTSVEGRELERLIGRLPELLHRRPKPSLLHGDLWSGNALPAKDPSGDPWIAVIDPACSIGDGLADIAMMRLFGGFPAVCFKAYGEARGIDLNAVNCERAIGVYQAYHLLNHLNLFGRGYAAQLLEVTKRLIAAD